MLREQGWVIAVEGADAVVSTSRRTSCGTCHSQATCGALSGGLGKKEVRLRARNDANATVGDMVTLELSESVLLRSSFLVYMMPVAALLVIGGLGRWVAMLLGLSPHASEGVGALVGLAGMALFFVILRGYNSRLEKTSLPVVSRVEEHCS